MMRGYSSLLAVSSSLLFFISGKVVEAQSVVEILREGLQISPSDEFLFANANCFNSIPNRPSGVFDCGHSTFKTYSSAIVGGTRDDQVIEWTSCEAPEYIADFDGNSFTLVLPIRIPQFKANAGALPLLSYAVAATPDEASRVLTIVGCASDATHACLASAAGVRVEPEIDLSTQFQTLYLRFTQMSGLELVLDPSASSVAFTDSTQSIALRKGDRLKISDRMADPACSSSAARTDPSTDFGRIASDPTNGAVQVSLNIQDIVFIFNEGVLVNTNGQMELSQTPTGASSATSTVRIPLRASMATGYVLTVPLGGNVPLLPSATITAKVLASSVKNYQGQPNGSDQILTFTTVSAAADGATFGLQSQSPSAGATDVPWVFPIMLTWSFTDTTPPVSPILGGSLTLKVESAAPGGDTTERTFAIADLLSSNKAVLDQYTFAISLDNFDANSNVQLTIPAGQLLDGKGVPNSAISMSFSTSSRRLTSACSSGVTTQCGQSDITEGECRAFGCCFNAQQTPSCYHDNLPPLPVVAVPSEEPAPTLTPVFPMNATTALDVRMLSFLHLEAPEPIVVRSAAGSVYLRSTQSSAPSVEITRWDVINRHLFLWIDVENPSVRFIPEATYQVFFPSEFIRGRDSLSNWELASIDWQFTLDARNVELEAPKVFVSGAVPRPESEGAEIAQSIVVPYDQPIKRGQGVITISAVSPSESTSLTLSVSDENAVLFKENLLIISPAIPLLYDAIVDVTVPTEAVMNSQSDVSSAVASFSFKTRTSARSTAKAPVLHPKAPFLPANSSSTVSLLSPLSVQFDQRIYLTTDLTKFVTLTPEDSTKDVFMIPIAPLFSSSSAALNAKERGDGWVEAAGSFLHIQVNKPFAPATQYTVTFPSDVIRSSTSQAFNPTEIRYVFTTEEGVANASTYEATLGVDASAAPVDSLVLLFDRQVAPAKELLASTPSKLPVISGRTINAADIYVEGQVVTFRLRPPLAPNSPFSLNLEAGSFISSDDEVTPALGNDAQTLSLTTAPSSDSTSPRLASSQLILEAAKVPSDLPFITEWDEVVWGGTTNIPVTVADGTTRDIAPDDATQVTILGGVVVVAPLNPPTSTSTSSVGRITFAADSLKDNSANTIITEVVKTYTFTDDVIHNAQFENTTADARAPNVLIYNAKLFMKPTNGESDVEVSPTLIVIFDEKVKISQGAIATIYSSTGSDSIRLSLNDDAVAKLDASSTVLLLRPPRPLLGSTSYIVSLAQGAVTDLRGNGFPGFGPASDRQNWIFTTVATTAPATTSPLTTVPSITPFFSHDASTFVIPFSQQLKRTKLTGNIEIYDTTDSAAAVLLHTASPDLDEIAIQGNTLLVRPLTVLPQTTAIQIRVPQNFVQAEFSNASNGPLEIDTATPDTVASATLPTVVSSLPKPTENDVTQAFDSSYVYVFSDRVTSLQTTSDGSSAFRLAIANEDLPREISLSDATLVRFIGRRMYCTVDFLIPTVTSATTTTVQPYLTGSSIRGRGGRYAPEVSSDTTAWPRFAGKTAQSTPTPPTSLDESLGVYPSGAVVISRPVYTWISVPVSASGVDLAAIYLDPSRPGLASFECRGSRSIQFQQSLIPTNSIARDSLLLVSISQHIPASTSCYVSISGPDGDNVIQAAFTPTPPPTNLERPISRSDTTPSGRYPGSQTTASTDTPLVIPFTAPISLFGSTPPVLSIQEKALVGGAQGTDVRSITILSSMIRGDALLIAPSEALIADTAFDVLLPLTNFRNPRSEATSAASGETAQVSYEMRTGASKADTLLPIFLAMSPPIGTEVPQDVGTVVVAFSKPLSPESGKVQSSFAKQGEITTVGSTMRLLGQFAIISFGPLELSTTWQVSIQGVDTSDNAISPSFDGTFSSSSSGVNPPTAVAPVVSSAVGQAPKPKDALTTIDPQYDQLVIIGFSNGPITRGETPMEITETINDAVTSEIKLTDCWVRPTANWLMCRLLGPLQPRAQYALKVPAGAVRSVNNPSLSNVAVTSAFTFVTAPIPQGLVTLTQLDSFRFYQSAVPNAQMPPAASIFEEAQPSHYLLEGGLCPDPQCAERFGDSDQGVNPTSERLTIEIETNREDASGNIVYLAFRECFAQPNATVTYPKLDIFTDYCPSDPTIDLQTMLSEQGRYRASWNQFALRGYPTFYVICQVAMFDAPVNPSCLTSSTSARMRRRQLQTTAISDVPLEEHRMTFGPYTAATAVAESTGLIIPIIETTTTAVTTTTTAPDEQTGFWWWWILLCALAGAILLGILIWLICFCCCPCCAQRKREWEEKRKEKNMLKEQARDYEKQQTPQDQNVRLPDNDQNVRIPLSEQERQRSAYAGVAGSPHNSKGGGEGGDVLAEPMGKRALESVPLNQAVAPDGTPMSQQTQIPPQRTPSQQPEGPYGFAPYPGTQQNPQQGMYGPYVAPAPPAGDTTQYPRSPYDRTNYGASPLPGHAHANHGGWGTPGNSQKGSYVPQSGNEETLPSMGVPRLTSMPQHYVSQGPVVISTSPRYAEPAIQPSGSIVVSGPVYQENGQLEAVPQPSTSYTPRSMTGPVVIDSPRGWVRDDAGSLRSVGPYQPLSGGQVPPPLTERSGYSISTNIIEASEDIRRQQQAAGIGRA